MISIVVVHWNTPELLAECLDSAANQHQNVINDITVVDCASPTNSHVAIVREFGKARLIQYDRNEGYAAACNLGAQAASSNTVLFLNADTVLRPEAATVLARCFDLSPAIGMVAPLLLNPDLSVQSSGYRFPGLMNLLCDLLPVPDRIRASSLNGRISPGNRFHPYAVDYALGAAIAVRRSALEDAGGWDETYGMYSEEIDLARRLEAGGWLRLIEPRAEVIHYGGSSTSQRPAEMEAALWRSRGRYYSKWSSGRRKIVIKAGLQAATRLGKNRCDGDAIRRAFSTGACE